MIDSGKTSRPLGAHDLNQKARGRWVRVDRSLRVIGAAACARNHSSIRRQRLIPKPKRRDMRLSPQSQPIQPIKRIIDLVAHPERRQEQSCVRRSRINRYPGNSIGKLNEVDHAVGAVEDGGCVAEEIAW